MTALMIANISLLELLLNIQSVITFSLQVKGNSVANQTYYVTDDTTLYQNNKRMWVYDDHDDLIELNFQIPSLIMISEAEKRLEDLKFFLYTRKSPDVLEQLFPDDVESLTNSRFDSKKPTKFVTHGWKSSFDGPSCTLIKDAYLTEGDYNVIIMDWSDIANSFYILAQACVYQIGLRLASMINFLEINGMNLSKTTLVGHSLGAHVVGIAGYNTDNIVNHVVGLDPAGPFFQNRESGFRISPESAKNVEIIHTNGDGLGLLKTLGHHDFYPNGGSKQLGCSFDPITACSHARSFYLYTEAILTNNKFYGKKCDSYDLYNRDMCMNDMAVIGDPTFNSNIHGKFYLQTSGQRPFSLGICGAKPSGVTECNVKKTTATIHYKSYNDQITNKKFLQKTN